MYSTIEYSLHFRHTRLTSKRTIFRFLPQPFDVSAALQPESGHVLFGGFCFVGIIWMLISIEPVFRRDDVRGPGT